MAYDETLAERIRGVLAKKRGITEKKMFGGIAFLLHGNMICGVVRTNLMLRLGNEGAGQALARNHVREMDFTGKPMKSMVYVGAAGLDGKALGEWVETAFAFGKTLPRK